MTISSVMVHWAYEAAHGWISFKRDCGITTEDQPRTSLFVRHSSPCRFPCTSPHLTCRKSTGGLLVCGHYDNDPSMNPAIFFRTLTAVLFLAFSAHGAIHYVDPNSSAHIPPYSSWTTA